MEKLVLSQIEECIYGLFENSCYELFEHHGHSITAAKTGGSLSEDNGESTESPEDSASIALIGASNDGVKISSGLKVSNALLKSSYPQNLGETTESHIRDWVGELSNQLLGRLKNKLLDHDCDIFMSVPMVVSGNNITQNMPKNASHRFFNFIAEMGSVEVSISVLFSGEFKFSLEKIAHEDGGVVDEGEMMFF